MSLNECRSLFSGICDAIHYAHTNNIIHRDLKPSNIMVSGEGLVKVMDFGLASELQGSMTRLTRQTVIGTASYMAPEQYDGMVKRETDIYAMGVSLYELLTGELPFYGPPLAIMKQKSEKDYPAPSTIVPELPAGADALIARALAPDPSQRYADALDFWAALKDL